MELKRYENSVFGSNTYVCKEASQKDAFIFDIGEFDGILKDLEGFNVLALFLTHAHFDHIFYINELVQAFPSIQVYAHEITLKALRNPKTNLSFYHNSPISFLGNNVHPLGNGFKEGHVKVGCSKVSWFCTPGHHPGSISFEVEKNLFTGDSFIPGVPVVTKLKGGDRAESKVTLDFLKAKIVKDNLIVAPGHGIIFSAEDALNCDHNDTK